MLQPLVQRNEGVLDALDELGLVRHLPGLQIPEEVQEQRGKVLGKLVRHVGKRGILRDLVADALKASINSTVESRSTCSSAPIVSKTMVGCYAIMKPSRKTRTLTYSGIRTVGAGEPWRKVVSRWTRCGHALVAAITFSSRR